ncbi:MAG: hypothetical protein GF308_09970 [Candidatus Heimdallarchaeota archaeon]|nr:hypothetical protein [Candidatus Heimdallarchaeota archaeon]
MAKKVKRFFRKLFDVDKTMEEKIRQHERQSHREAEQVEQPISRTPSPEYLSPPDSEIKISIDKVTIWPPEESKNNLIYVVPNSKKSVETLETFGVMEFQRALIFDGGKLIGTVAGGVYEILKDNLRPGTKVIWCPGPDAIFRLEWGAAKGITGLFTKDFMEMGISGEIRYSIVDAERFVQTIIQRDINFTTDDVNEWMKKEVLSSMLDFARKYTYDEIKMQAMNRRQLNQEVKAHLGTYLADYGLRMRRVFLERPTPPTPGPLPPIARGILNTINQLPEGSVINMQQLAEKVNNHFSQNFSTMAVQTTLNIMLNASGIHPEIDLSGKFYELAEVPIFVKDEVVDTCIQIIDSMDVSQEVALNDFVARVRDFHKNEPSESIEKKLMELIKCVPKYIHIDHFAKPKTLKRVGS